MLKPLLFAIASAALLLTAGEHVFHDKQSAGDPLGIPGRSQAISPSIFEQDPARQKPFQGETIIRYAGRVSSMVHLSSYHCQTTDFSLSAIERVLERSMSQSQNFDWQQGLLNEQMLCGLCHQRAITVAMILRENGVDAWAYGINGHVAVKFADKGGTPYIVDPDYGAPPFLYDGSDEVVSTEIRAAYRNATLNNAEDVLPMYLSRGDNVSYYTPEYFQQIVNARQNLYDGADSVSAGLAGAGAILAVLAVFFARRARQERVGRLTAT